MIVPTDFADFFECEAIKELREKALTYPPLEPTATDFYDIRDFLIFTIVQANAQRPMAVRGITPRGIRRARVEEDGSAAITVCFYNILLECSY